MEGGGETLGSFIDAKTVDRVYVFYAPIIIGGREAVTVSGKGSDKIVDALRFKTLSVKKFREDILVIADNPRD
ncbi:MAG: Bifunctional riboflavin biosynthesis protein RibD [Candidatus Kaiserbacteria bacterium GW2011_GWA2_49_19]|uniref:Bifunctional riboflavin biosynthesis protein RibD n=1 Tax=Candidatus Kaiserbacteria bacterium GW2011_GWA2_49_19 TaxID=1618669 RepID=A0A0G1VP12_9BACT|nr:MAG: Bifunctional riboflavin biosynthesis protein RibD [Candidatus Kaiserbacteria bacterium GW2011_GWA2_49_19]